MGDVKVPREEDSSRLRRMMAKSIGVRRSQNWDLCIGLVFYVCAEFVQDAQIEDTEGRQARGAL